MKKNYFSRKVLQACVLFFMIITANVFAQVGIGTITPHASSVLDVSSTTQGMLTPRMTTAQRTAIASPADGLMVYDTDLKAFYHFNSSLTSWSVINSGGTTDRLKFKRIKSTDVLATVLAAEKVAGGGTKYLLDSGTLYEINGFVTFDLPIDLNSSYISGVDTNEDRLIRTSGNLFDGATGGSIRSLSIQVSGGGKVFNISGNATQNLIFRDSIVLGSSNVGSISGLGLVFISIVQYAANTTGIVYENISKLLISNAGWFGNNSGTYERLQGTFDLVQKQGGFTEVVGANIGFDVSSNPVINGDAVLETVVFTGALTSAGRYVNGYTSGTFPGYNFNNSWIVLCAGIPTETDSDAVGEFSVDYPVGSGASTTFNTTNPSNTVKVQAVSTSTNLFRFSTGGVNNRLIYQGRRKRFFQVSGSISFQVSNPSTYIIYVARNGTVVSQYKIYGRGLVVNDIVVLPLNALVELSPNDFVEVFVQRFSSNLLSDSIVTPNMTLVVK
ncbi:hypothetical protein [Flavobacterium glaciei]|uniref:Cell wall anchor protein n=1 Tax=Flavobacterium glaciei TaxID=386300 RepID=A0A562PN19_9FLAO|nr:hypothetical protein [Flavobacterium glaciei]RDI52214.1 hypothetical protein DFR66_11259 [Flavobacterium glaciei]TWI45600.1 hypothetical protein IQ02_02276 [Flavobacterium glaciei]